MITRRNAISAGFVAAIAARSDLAFAASPPQVRPASSPFPWSSYALVDPELLPALDMKIPEVMARLPTMAQAQASGRPVKVSERFVPGPSGAPDVRVLQFLPTHAGSSVPAMIYIHGGGYTSGTAEMTIRDCMDFAEHAGCAVFSVDYRLAPQARFPASLLDIYAVLTWVHAHGAALGIDPGRLGVGGFSAGGGHAAAVAIHARDNGGPKLKLQLLSCPMLDDRTAATVEPGAYVGEFTWGREANRKGWQALLGVEPGSAGVPVAAVPARAPDLAGLAPAFITVGQLDLFLDESLEYARRLAHAGVWAGVNVTPGAFHGFDLMLPDASASLAFREGQVAAIRKAFSI